jgi:hypothetical protein
MKNLLLACTIIGFVVAGGTYPVVLILDHGATEAYIIDPYSPEAVAVNRDPSMLDLPAKTDPKYPRKVMELYGFPSEEPNRLVFVSQNRYVHPVELPSLTLLPVNKQKGENPLQVKTLYFFARYIVLTSAPVSVVMLAVWALLFRKAAPSAAPPGSAKPPA